MHGLILAGGAGSRLAQGGMTVPKPLMTVAGSPQILRLLRTFAALGCKSLTCAVRADFPAVRALLEGKRFGAPLTVIECRTPSSLHTLVAGLAVVPPGPVFCTMVDTVMRWEDWKAAWRDTRAQLERGADAVLVVTPHVDDEAPLYVTRGADGAITAVGSAPTEPRCVTGGVYGFAADTRRVAAEALDRGVERMRGFLGALVAGGRRVGAVEIDRIIDVDRPADLRVADAWLAAEPLSGENP